MVESSVSARVKRKRLLGSSVLALTMGIGGAALADCLPAAPTPTTPVTCSGTTVTELTISTSGVVDVAVGATLERPAAADYAALLIKSAAGATPGTAVTLNVDGTISGAGWYAILATSTGANNSFPATRLDTTVGQTGKIDGVFGIFLAGSYSQSTGWAPVIGTVDNSGLISSSYKALYASDSQTSGFQSITNRAGGVIQGADSAIDGVVGVLTNDGLISAGSGSAYRFSYYPNTSFAVYPQSVVNTGTMVSGGSNATISLPAGYVTITNSGTIRNDGAGAAIDTANFVTLTNQAGGVIQAAGSTAIRADSGTIVNAGTINGGITITGAQGYAALVDNSQGTINGAVRFGSTDDTLIARWDADAGHIDGISGAVDGGGGTNTLRFDFTQDVTLDSLMQHVALPTNFQKLGVMIGAGATATLTGDAVDGLLVGGSGRFVTTGKVTSAGAAFITTLGPPWDYSATLGFRNTGEITSAFAPPGGVIRPSDFALALQNLNDFSNTGTITATGGGGVSANFLWSTPGGTFTNSGEIVADGTAVGVSSANFVNSGKIRSTAGTGLALGDYGMTGVNTGAIEGATYGVSLYGALSNSGTIKATNGVGVLITSAALENLAGGVITGSKASIANGYSARVTNAGTLNGDVDFTAGYYSNDVFINKGGTLNGGLLMGDGEDVFVTTIDDYANGKFKSVTGSIDGGAGVDRLILRATANTTAKIASATSFERVAYELGDGVSLTLTADKTFTSMLMLAGKGKVDLTADMTVNDGYGILVTNPFDGAYTDIGEVSIVSHGALSFSSTNYSSVGVALSDKSTFENLGSMSVTGRPFTSPPAAGITGGKLVTNSGTIVLDGAAGVTGALEVVNTGSIVQSETGGRSLGLYNAQIVDNSGVINTAGDAVTLYYYNYSTPTTTTPSVTNSGVIHSTAGNAILQYSSGAATITNTATGQIISDTALAISTGGYGDTVRNDGEIVGGINLNYGDDRLENYGSITGDVNLGDGNDTFVQWVGGSVSGTVDGGYGLDTLVIDSTGGGSITASRFTGFETYKQIGGGSLNYAGDFGMGPIVLDGNAAAVQAGASVSVWGGVAFGGGAGSEQVTVEGAVYGSISLGDGADAVVNRGIINGSVLLGDGADSYTEGGAASVSGVIDGGAGSDTYIVELAGDRAGLRARSGFENLGIVGAGDMTLTLDQDWDSISLDGSNLYLESTIYYGVGRLSGGDRAETARIDSNIAQVDLGGGADGLQFDFAQLTGAYAGGAGSDTALFTSTGPVTVAGSLSGFETIVLDGGQMAVSGTLGAAGDTATFHGGGAQTLTLLSGGVLAGTVDLGAGDDLFQMAAGGRLTGTVLGGAGDDRVVIDLASDLSLRGDQLQQFETLQVTGTGALNFTGGAAKFQHLVTQSKDLTLAAGASLDAGDLTLGGDANTVTLSGSFSGALDLGAGDDVLRLTTGGTFTGAAHGGAGQDSLVLALGGTDAAPIALGATPFDGFETLSVQSGVISVSGGYGFDSIQVQSGRLIGLAGSQLTASNITVGQGATFGSAGAVNGNIAVAGTLSPGASPGTMTVTGDVALAAGSTALFEFTPTVSDKLVVSGTVTIAQGSTLKLVGAAALTPGRRLDLITAGGGIIGSFSTIDGAQGLNLHIEQSATRLQALGLFTTDTAFSSQVSDLIGQFNTALIDDKVSASLIAALPLLVDPATSKSDPRALARVTPQAYASASQLAVEDGLTVVEASRAQARFAPQTPGLFGFGQAIASQRKLDGDAAAGIAKGKIDTTGGLAGVGYGVDSAWAGVFVGYLNGRQRINGLDVRTGTDSFVIGAQGQVRVGDFQLGAMAAHDGADVDTRRTAPGGTAASGDYKLKSWIADVNLTYRAKLNADWVVQPRLGASYVQTTRDGLTERGGGAFGLAVQGDKASAWFIDGQVEVLGGQTAGARLHPFASLGLRTTASGGRTAASATLTGLPTPIVVEGLARDGTLATAGAGAAYDLSRGLTVSATYAGEFGDGGRQGVFVGLNWKF